MVKRQEGGKRLKHGPADRKASAREEQALIRTALSMAHDDEVEQALRDLIDQSSQTNIDEGEFDPLLWLSFLFQPSGGGFIPSWRNGSKVRWP